jgi:hypothetical protein
LFRISLWIICHVSPLSLEMRWSFIEWWGAKPRGECYRKTVQVRHQDHESRSHSFCRG